MGGMLEFTMKGSWCIGLGGEIKAENLVIQSLLHYTETIEVKGAQPSVLSLLLPYHVTLRWMADLRGCN